MKKILCLLLILTSPSLWAENWRKEDTYREVAFQTLAAIDWGQTRYIAHNCDKYRETNPILGSCPSTGKVDTYMPLAMLAHAGISYALPPKYREVWQWTTIVIEGGYVVNNYRIGINVRW